MRYKKEKKLFWVWEYQEEEQWLNEKSAQGFQLVEYRFPGRYFFKEGKPGEYLYRYELLDGSPDAAHNQDYLHFLEEMGIEEVCRYLNYVYVRRRAELGPFALFNDLPSRIAYLQRIAKLLRILCVLEIIALLCNMPAVFMGFAFNMFVVGFSLALFLLLLVWLGKISSKIRDMEEEQVLRE